MRRAEWIVTVLLLVLIALLAVVSVVRAEMYGTLLGGFNDPLGFSDFRAQYAWEGRQHEDDLLQRQSLVLGGKLGYGLSRYVAVELEALQAWPHQSQQAYTQWARPHGGDQSWQCETGTLAGVNWSMLTIATNLVLRYPMGDWMPYLGAGPALFRGNYGGLTNNPSIGLNTLAGVRYQVADGWRVLVEYHYQENKQTYKEWDGYQNGFTGIYQTQMVLFGIEKTFGGF